MIKFFILSLLALTTCSCAIDVSPIKLSSQSNLEPTPSRDVASKVDDNPLSEDDQLLANTKTPCETALPR